MKKPDKTTKTKSEYVHIRINPELKKKLNEFADSENMNISSVVTMALSLFMTHDVEDESLLLARIAHMDDKLTGLIDSFELFSKYIMDYFHFNMMFSPSLPDDTRSYNLLLSGATLKYKKFLTLFRNRLATMPRLQEAILGNMLQEKNINYPDKKTEKKNTDG